MPTKEAVAAYAKAFNCGADARLAGVELSACPYGRDKTSEHLAWCHGWKEADRHYAQGVRGRWRYRRPGQVRKSPRAPRAACGRR